MRARLTSRYPTCTVLAPRSTSMVPIRWKPDAVRPLASLRILRSTAAGGVKQGRKNRGAGGCWKAWDTQEHIHCYSSLHGGTVSSGVSIYGAADSLLEDLGFKHVRGDEGAHDVRGTTKKQASGEDYSPPSEV